MRALFVSLCALALASCSYLEAATDPVTGRVGGLAGLALEGLSDMAYVLRAGERGDSLPPACEQYLAVKRRASEVTAESTTAFLLCQVALDATEDAAIAYAPAG